MSLTSLQILVTEAVQTHGLSFAACLQCELAVHLPIQSSAKPPGTQLAEIKPKVGQTACEGTRSL